MTVTLSSPDKVLWPARGFTKQDLYEYVLAAADRLLPHLRDRPLSVKRFPRGVGGPGFFQKDLPEHAPPTIGRWRQWAESSDREVAYALVEDADGLAWFAQQNTIEFHPGITRVDQPASVDTLVFDVDPGPRALPPGRVALWVRDVLAEVGLQPLAKTSGGRGIHVLVPIERRYDIFTLRPMVLAIARMVVDAHPDDLTVEMRKDERGGRTLLDWSRSGPGATLIAPWSPRGHPQATVATPVAWDEVDDDLDPTSFTLDTVLERKDPWDGDPAATPQRLEATRDALLDAGYELVDASPRARTASYFEDN